MDLRKIKKLIELLEESDISEIEVHEGEESVRISRASQMPPPAMQYHYVGNAPAMPSSVVVHSPTAATDQPPPDTVDVTSDEVVAQEGTAVVKSPMVGTFYRARSPGEPPFVEDGKPIEAGETICLIEAMKMMNQIEAPVSGTVKFLIENGVPVEFGQAIATIKT